MNRPTQLIALASGLLLLAAGSIFAQSGVDSSVVERVRQVEQERRTGLTTTENYLKTTGQNCNLSGWGAWFSNTFIDFSDDDKNSRLRDPLTTLNIRDVRAWWTTKIGSKFSSYL